MCFITILFFVPVSAQAGLFSSIVGFIADSDLVEEIDERVNYSAIETPLLSATAIDPMAATGGGDITVKDGSLISAAPVTESEQAEAGGGGEISVYTVREGDALSQIAEMYGVTTNTILWANDVSSASAIRPGDSLVILPMAGVRHTVKDGETLASIVKKYDAEIDEVLTHNDLVSADDLSVGDDLMIPGGSIKTAKYAGRPTPTNSSVSASSLGFSHPVPGAIRTQGIHGYNGVDLASNHGTAIHAAAAGEVIVSKGSGYNGGYGQYVVIRHSNGTQTLYAHLSNVYVSSGEWVNSGTTVGAMGNTGRSTGTHLHFEVRGASNPF